MAIEEGGLSWDPAALFVYLGVEALTGKQHVPTRDYYPARVWNDPVALAAEQARLENLPRLPSGKGGTGLERPLRDVRARVQELQRAAAPAPSPPAPLPVPQPTPDVLPPSLEPILGPYDAAFELLLRELVLAERRRPPPPPPAPTAPYAIGPRIGVLTPWSPQGAPIWKRDDDLLGRLFGMVFGQVPKPSPGPRRRRRAPKRVAPPPRPPTRRTPPPPRRVPDVPIRFPRPTWPMVIFKTREAIERGIREVQRRAAESSTAGPTKGPPTRPPYVKPQPFPKIPASQDAPGRTIEPHALPQVGGIEPIPAPRVQRRPYAELEPISYPFPRRLPLPRSRPFPWLDILRQAAPFALPRTSRSLTTLIEQVAAPGQAPGVGRIELPFAQPVARPELARDYRCPTPKKRKCKPGPYEKKIVDRFHYESAWRTCK